MRDGCSASPVELRFVFPIRRQGNALPARRRIGDTFYGFDGSNATSATCSARSKPGNAYRAPATASEGVLPGAATGERRGRLE